MLVLQVFVQGSPFWSKSLRTICMITDVAFSIVVIIAGEINHPLHPLWRGQDLIQGRMIVVVVVGIKYFSVLRELGRASRWEWLADGWGRLKAMVIHPRRYGHRRQLEASSTADHRRMVGGESFENLTTVTSVELWAID
jgi:hypothetical protein